MKTMYQKLLLLLLMLPLSALAQSTVSGTVSDNTSGQPLPGVNVIVEGTTNGTSTDMDGNFTLTNVNNGDRLVFTFIGFTTQTVTYSGQSIVTVVMQEDSQELDEVVVIGYGTTTRKDATGSVTTVSSREFNRGANVTTENLINGRVAGLTVNTSGAPGSGSEIRIRGGSSLFASNDPLIVVDGLPLDNTTNTGSTSFLASLNPNTIESFTVLKDASATAIYGSRASNGVIIITTKKGGKQLAVDYNFMYGTGRLVKKVDVFNADEFRAIVTERLPGLANRLGNANTDWQEEIYRRTDYVDNNLSLRGSLFGVIPTRLTLGNTYQEGLRLTNYFNRNTVSVAMNPTFFDNHLKLTLNANYADERNRFASGVEGSALRFDPTQPVYDETSPFGGFYEHRNGNVLLIGARNPVAELMQRREMGNSDRIFGNFEFDYKFHFLPELRAVVNVGIDKSKGTRTLNIPSNSAVGGSNGGQNFFGNNEFTEQNFENKLLDAYLVYNKTFGKFGTEVTAGYSYQKFERETYFTRNILDPNYIGDELNIDPDVVLIGFFGRANFSYNDKYLLTLSYRRDGSSRFSEDNRWGNFPAAAFAWKIKEDFFKDVQTLSDLKLRLGYGITGQQNIPAAYFYLQRYTQGDPNSQIYFGETAYPIGVPAAYNPLIKWEETTTYNVGIDYGLFNDRITGALDVFYKKSDDLLAEVANADGSNFSNRGWQNIGSFTTKGIEFAINAEIVKSQDFNWNINLNATKFERRIEDLAYDSDIFVGGIAGGTGANIQVLREGYTPYAFYVRKQLYDEAGRPIEGAFADLNGNGITDDGDKYLYKNPDPDLTLGFASYMNYKNFDFSFNLRASIGNRIYNNVDSARAQYNLLQDNATLGNIPTSVLDSGFSTSAGLSSDYYIENASFLRMDNITLGYTFTNWLAGKASVRLSAGCQNAFVITEYSGLDPEITGGIDNTIYPRQRSFLFGANVKF